MTSGAPPGPLGQELPELSGSPSGPAPALSRRRFIAATGAVTGGLVAGPSLHGLIPGPSLLGAGMCRGWVTFIKYLAPRPRCTSRCIS
jgi:hypothetical protein